MDSSTDWIRMPFETFSSLLVDCHFRYGHFCPSDLKKATQIHREYVALLKTLFEGQDGLQRIQQACDAWKRITYAPEPEPVASCDECRAACVAVQEEYNDRLATLYGSRERWLRKAVEALKPVVTKLECQLELAVSRRNKGQQQQQQPEAIQMVNLTTRNERPGAEARKNYRQPNNKKAWHKN